MGSEDDAATALHDRYLALCNEHRVDELADLVAEDVSGSAPVDGRDAYLEGVAAVCRAFPDYRWELQDRVVRAGLVAARLTGRGTHTAAFSGVPATGRRIETQELVIYRIADGRIAQCWGDLFPVVRDALSRAGAPGDARW